MRRCPKCNKLRDKFCEDIRLNSELEVLTAIKQELPTAFKKIKKNGRTNSS